MKYLLLIYHNPGARQVWEAFSDAQRAEGLAAYLAAQPGTTQAARTGRSPRLRASVSAAHTNLRPGSSASRVPPGLRPGVA
jgi:hypothetical protein